MKKLFTILNLCLGLSVVAHAWAADTNQPTVIVVVGAAGEDAYGEMFAKWAGYWQEAASKGGAKFIAIGLDKDQGKDRDNLQKHLAAESPEGTGELWLVLLGHGTYDGKVAKFNLRGPDVSDEELADWLKPIHRPVAIIDTSSSSAPFLAKLSHANRVIVTATQSGFEQNFTRFGGYLSKAIADPEADLDKDGQTSLLEAYLMAARKTAEYYETEGRLATEHALLDDNGDGLGTPPDWFRGVRAVKKARDGAELDGFRAHQFHLVRSLAEQKMPAELRAKRDELELAINRLREKKPNMPANLYYQELEKLLFDLAHIYEKAGLIKAD